MPPVLVPAPVSAPTACTRILAVLTRATTLSVPPVPAPMPVMPVTAMAVGALPFAVHTVRRRRLPITAIVLHGAVRLLLAPHALLAVTKLAERRPSTPTPVPALVRRPVPVPARVPVLPPLFAVSVTHLRCLGACGVRAGTVATRQGRVACVAPVPVVAVVPPAVFVSASPAAVVLVTRLVVTVTITITITDITARS